MGKPTSEDFLRGARTWEEFRRMAPEALVAQEKLVICDEP